MSQTFVEMPKTKAERNKYSREWRKNNYEEKRFNKGLRGYLEIKYRDIYNKYNWFYKSLSEQHPNAKDLTKTKTYKAWKKRQLNCEDIEQENQQQDETEPTQPSEQENQQQDETEPTQPSEQENQQQDETEPTQPSQAENQRDILAEALGEPLSPNNIERLDIDELDNMVQRVIDELEQDESVRNLLNDQELLHPHYRDEDEGIDLDVEIELEAIVEPFDYQVEVEGLDY